MHGDPSVEECGRVCDPQIMKPQSGKTELTESLPRCLGESPRVANSREVKPPTMYATGGKDQRGSGPMTRPFFENKAFREEVNRRYP